MNKVLVKIKITFIEETSHVAYSAAVVNMEELSTEIRKSRSRSYSIPSGRADWRPR